MNGRLFSQRWNIGESALLAIARWSLCPLDYWRETLKMPPYFPTSQSIWTRCGSFISCHVFDSSTSGAVQATWSTEHDGRWFFTGALSRLKVTAMTPPPSPAETNHWCLNKMWFLPSVGSQRVSLPLVLQPVGFVTFDSRSGAEAAKNALNVSMASF